MYHRPRIVLTSNWPIVFALVVRVILGFGWLIVPLTFSGMLLRPTTKYIQRVKMVIHVLNARCISDLPFERQSSLYPNIEAIRTQILASYDRESV